MTTSPTVSISTTSATSSTSDSAAGVGAAGGASLGASSTNEYHFAQAGLGSFGAFLDLAGLDLYPAGRADDSTAASPEAPAAELRDQDGAFIDANSTPKGSSREDAGPQPRPAAP